MKQLKFKGVLLFAFIGAIFGFVEDGEGKKP